MKLSIEIYYTSTYKSLISPAMIATELLSLKCDDDHEKKYLVLTQSNRADVCFCKTFKLFFDFGSIWPMNKTSDRLRRIDGLD